MREVQPSFFFFFFTFPSSACVKTEIFSHLSPGLWGNVFLSLSPPPHPRSLISLHGEVPLMACCGSGCFGGAGACRYIERLLICALEWSTKNTEPVTNLSVECEPRRYGRPCKAADAADSNEIHIMNECSSFSLWAQEVLAYYQSFHLMPVFSSGDPTSG